MTLKELQQKYPDSKVVQEPLPECPKCKGQGEFINKKKQSRACLCVCLTDNDDLRKIAVESLIDAVKKLGQFIKQ